MDRIHYYILYVKILCQLRPLSSVSCLFQLILSTNFYRNIIHSETFIVFWLLMIKAFCVLALNGVIPSIFSSSFYIINQKPMLPWTYFLCITTWVAHYSGWNSAMHLLILCFRIYWPGASCNAQLKMSLNEERSKLSMAAMEFKGNQ